MCRFFLLVFSVVFYWQQAYAGVEMRCPDLSQGKWPGGWEVKGLLHKVQFRHVLISVNRAMGVNTVTCNYEDSVSLTRLGNFQPGAHRGAWSPVNIGGVYFKQCMASLEICHFFKDDEMHILSRAPFLWNQKWVDEIDAMLNNR